MKLASYLPSLTSAEVTRCWMTPVEVCDLAAIGDPRQDQVRRFLNNVSDRGYVPFEKSGTGRTAPRLYSLQSAVMLRALREITASGRTYEFAAPIAAQAGDLLVELVARASAYDDVDENDWLICYSSNWHGVASDIRLIRADDFTPAVVAIHFDVGVLAAGSLLWNALHNYKDCWARNRIQRGVDRPGRYDGADVNGHPLDPAHPWNASLPPLERARRLLEIEEYITARENAERCEGDDA